MLDLFLVKADELEGEHSRLIEFLVRAPEPEIAKEMALGELRGEWVTDPDSDSTDEKISFFGGEIVIDDIRIEPVTPGRALDNFIRADWHDEFCADCQNPHPDCATTPNKHGCLHQDALAKFTRATYEPQVCRCGHDMELHRYPDGCHYLGDSDICDCNFVYGEPKPYDNPD